MKKTSKKLQLNPTRIKPLADTEVKQAVGGWPSQQQCVSVYNCTIGCVTTCCNSKGISCPSINVTAASCSCVGC